MARLPGRSGWRISGVCGFFLFLSFLSSLFLCNSIYLVIAVRCRTQQLKDKGMWNMTLMILHADNGGYTKALGPCSDGTDPVKGVTCMTGEAGANNFPLRGGKYSFFEGGIRANSFASGGLLPTAVRGTRLSGLMHVADWFVTYCAFAKIDSTDKPGELAGVPPVEGLDMWPLLSGKNMTSPRTEIFFSSQALIVGNWKLLTGSIKSAAWAGPTYPNATSDGNTLDQCKFCG